MMDLLLPAIRADLALTEEYTYAPEPPLGCPLSAFSGRDDPWVDVSEVEAWAEHSAAGFLFRSLPGDHFYLRERREELLGHIAEDLARLPSTRG